MITTFEKKNLGIVIKMADQAFDPSQGQEIAATTVFKLRYGSGSRSPASPSVYYRKRVFALRQLLFLAAL